MKPLLHTLETFDSYSNSLMLVLKLENTSTVTVLWRVLFQQNFLRDYFFNNISYRKGQIRTELYI
jgi:hypothetical protein